MSNWRFGIVVVVLIGISPLMGEVLCSTENSPFLIIDHIHAKLHTDCNNVGQVCNPDEHLIAGWYMLRFITGRLVFKIPTHLH